MISLRNFELFFPYLTQLESLDVGNVAVSMDEAIPLIAKHCSKLKKLKLKTPKTDSLPLLFQSITTNVRLS